jgi:hypothetical protein
MNILMSACFKIKNFSTPQMFDPQPEFGSVISFIPSILTIPPNSSVSYTDLSSTRLYINLTPGADKTTELLALRQA